LVHCTWQKKNSITVPDFHAEQQPQSPEYCLHHSISEKFNIRKLFGKRNRPTIIFPMSFCAAFFHAFNLYNISGSFTESFGLFDEENSSNIVPEPSTVMQPVTSSDASGAHIHYSLLTIVLVSVMTIYLDEQQHCSIAH